MSHMFESYQIRPPCVTDVVWNHFVKLLNVCGKKIAEEPALERWLLPSIKSTYNRLHLIERYQTVFTVKETRRRSNVNIGFNDEIIVLITCNEFEADKFAERSLQFPYPRYEKCVTDLEVYKTQPL